MRALAIVLLLAVTAAAQAPMLTDVERAKVAPAMLQHLDTACTPVERRIISNRDTARFRCPEGVVQIEIFDGSTTVEPKGLAAFKARLGRGVLYTIGAALTVLVIYGQAHS